MVNVLLYIAIFLASIGCAQNTRHVANQKHALPVPAELSSAISDCRKCLVLAEQSISRVAIADVDLKAIVWEWRPSEAVKSEHVGWFHNMSEAKPVYNGKYILATASGGGVALVRIADKKTMFYAFAGGNTHSAELLPDGNIVSASSTGNFMTLFKVDTVHFPEGVYSLNVPLAFGHNVVWDHKNQRLWTAAMDKMKVFSYNFNCSAPALTLETSIDLPGTEAHDLFPDYHENVLWLTNTTNVYKFDVVTNTLKQAGVLQANIKSVSSGPDSLPVIVIQPKEKWWTDEVKDAQGDAVFYQQGLKIYKARWMVPNTFSYPAHQSITQCGK